MANISRTPGITKFQSLNYTISKLGYLKTIVIKLTNINHIIETVKVS